MSAIPLHRVPLLNPLEISILVSESGGGGGGSMTDITDNKLLKACALYFRVINAVRSVAFSDFRLIKCTLWSIPLSVMSKASLL